MPIRPFRPSAATATSAVGTRRLYRNPRCFPAGSVAQRLETFGDLIRRLTLYKNEAEAAGGGIDIFLAGGGTAADPAEIALSKIFDNRVISPSGHGGGVRMIGGTLEFTDTIVATNSAGQGGGLYLGGVEVSFDKCGINGNEAATLGGGAFTAGSTITVSRTSISGNEAGGLGSGLLFGEKTLFMQWSSLVGNTVAPSLALGGDVDVTIERTLISSASGSECADGTTSLTFSDTYAFGTDDSCPFVGDGSDPAASVSSYARVDASFACTTGLDGPILTCTAPSHWAVVGTPGTEVDWIPGTDSTCSSTGHDQIGTTRPDVASGDCDVGAIEYVP